MNAEQFQQLLAQAQQGPTRFNVGGVEYVLNALSVPTAGGAQNTLQHVFENVAELTATAPEKTTDDNATGSNSGGESSGQKLAAFQELRAEPETHRTKVPWKS